MGAFSLKVADCQEQQKGKHCYADHRDRKTGIIVGGLGALSVSGHCQFSDGSGADVRERNGSAGRRIVKIDCVLDERGSLARSNPVGYDRKIQATGSLEE